MKQSDFEAPFQDIEGFFQGESGLAQFQYLFGFVDTAGIQAGDSKRSNLRFNM